jgi:hypothetical protein
MNNKIWHSLGHAGLVLFYIWIIAEIMTHFDKKGGGNPGILVPIAILSLLVLSVTVVGTLIFGRPVLIYLNGQKKEAIQFLGYTVLWMFLITAIVLAVSFRMS